MLVGILLKYVLPVIAVIAVLFGVYEAGKSSGYEQGHQVAWDTQQKTINSMVDQQNLETTQNNLKISQLEFGSRAALDQVTAAQKQIATQRKQIIASYKINNSAVAQQCGLAVPTVQAINQLLKADGTQPASAPIGASQ